MPARENSKKKKKRGFLLELPAGLQEELDALCEAYFGSPRQRIIAEALQEFMQTRFAAEPEVAKRFRRHLEEAVKGRIELVGDEKASDKRA